MQCYKWYDGKFESKNTLFHAMGKEIDQLEQCITCEIIQQIEFRVLLADYSKNTKYFLFAVSHLFARKTKGCLFSYSLEFF